MTQDPLFGDRLATRLKLRRVNTAAYPLDFSEQETEAILALIRALEESSSWASYPAAVTDALSALNGDQYTSGEFENQDDEGAAEAREGEYTAWEIIDRGR